MYDLRIEVVPKRAPGSEESSMRMGREMGNGAKTTEEWR